MKTTLLILAALVLAGCAAESTVTVGNPGHKGFVRHEIDHSRSVASQASQQVKQGEQDANGL